MLKKMSVLFAVGVVFVLTACGGRRETTTVCVNNGVDFFGVGVLGNMTMEIEAIGDRVTVENARIVFDFEGEEDYIDEIVESIEFFAMMAVDGLTVDIEVEGTNVSLIMITDYDAMSEEDLRVMLEGYDFISLELTVEALEEDGATCTVVDND